jgi:hypothetical protein
VVTLYHEERLASLDLHLTILVGRLPLLEEYCTRGISTLVFYVLFDLVFIIR